MPAKVMGEHRASVLVILDRSYSMKDYMNTSLQARQVFDQPPTVTTPPDRVWLDPVQVPRNLDASETLCPSDTDISHTELLLYLTVLLLALITLLFCYAIYFCH